jgi:hypothetical protein
MKKEKFFIEILKIPNNKEPAQWESFIISTYKQAVDQIKEKYNYQISRDILQNILLNRNDVRNQYPHIRMKYCDTYQPPIPKKPKVCHYCQKEVK